MKKFMPLIGIVFGILGIVVAVTVNSSVTLGMGILLTLLVSPAICCQIHDMLPSVKRKQEERSRQFSEYLEYAEHVKNVYLQPTIHSMRKLVKDGFFDKVNKISVEHPLVYKIMVENFGGYENFISFKQKLDDAKNTDEWKILDGFENNGSNN